MNSSFSAYLRQISLSVVLTGATCLGISGQSPSALRLVLFATWALFALYAALTFIFGVIAYGAPERFPQRTAEVPENARFVNRLLLFARVGLFASGGFYGAALALVGSFACARLIEAFAERAWKSETGRAEEPDAPATASPAADPDAVEFGPGRILHVRGTITISSPSDGSPHS